MGQVASENRSISDKHRCLLKFLSEIWKGKLAPENIRVFEF